MQLNEVILQFHDDSENDIFFWWDLSDNILSKTRGIYAKLPHAVFQRSADALHLISAMEYGVQRNLYE